MDCFDLFLVIFFNFGGSGEVIVGIMVIDGGGFFLVVVYFVNFGLFWLGVVGGLFFWGFGYNF